jgi:hypothetical protein
MKGEKKKRHHATGPRAFFRKKKAPELLYFEEKIV